ncbi:MAG: bifunctional GNAT family N-acetyltransferase/carbon-nitrogen hydrolase family protein [Gammaproteobacteria bacterium]|nr:bifunctional GNAT family N-acetyltransferase/carbon-nitrogen hydrolase family protein [Gammaproteobacteria bacterium]
MSDNQDKAPSGKEQTPRIEVRVATNADIDAIQALSRQAYPDFPIESAAQLRGRIQNFPQGQLVVVYEQAIVGYCASFMVSETVAFGPHDWHSITGGGFASRHDPDGAWLYGMEMCVSPRHRGLRIGQRLYRARKALAERLGLKGVVICGRLSGLARRIGRVGSAEAYVDQLRERKLRDPVISFQLRNGFEVVRVMPDYLPEDRESLGFGVLLVWKNSKYVEYPQDATARSGVRAGPPESVRVGIVQYQQRRIGSFEEFARQVEYFVDVVADYNGDFVVFPELFTLQLLSLEERSLPAAEAVARVAEHTPALKALLSRLAVSFNINIIGGSHPTLDDSGELRNISYVCLRDGSLHMQAKIHPTPNERYWWGISGGSSLNTIQTDCGPIGVLICYDCEFPELGRHLIDQGARILFVPFCTDERQSYLRVRYCGHARAVENQCYVVLAGNVGNLPNVENMDIQYAQSCILTPCDFPFARDGIAADTTPNAEMVAFADLRLGDLESARRAGTVQNLKDRRFDLYSVRWRNRQD